MFDGTRRPLRRSKRPSLAAAAAAAMACAIVASACAGDGPPPRLGGSTTTLGTGAASFAMIQQSIFTPSCAMLGCHDALTQSEGLNLSDASTSHSELVGVVSNCASRVLVVAGNPDASYLIDKIGDGAQAPCGSPMPLGMPPLSAAQKLLLRDWIAAGAPPASFGISVSTTTSSTLSAAEER